MQIKQSSAGQDLLLKFEEERAATWRRGAVGEAVRLAGWGLEEVREAVGRAWWPRDCCKKELRL